MQVYSLGSDELDLYEITEDQFEWAVYSYWSGDYEGGGDIVALGKDGLIYYAGLGHCSCYGPMDSWPDRKITVEEFLRPKDNVLDLSFTDDVYKKVCELLGR